MKRILTVLLAALLVLSSAACGNGENTVNNEIFPKKTEMKTDGQLYTGGEVKFPATLWETPTAERYDALGILEPWCNYGRVFSANERANELWNTTEIIRASRTPMLFVCGSNDTFIPLAAIARSAAAAKYGNILIIQGYPHSHAHGSDVEEIFVFADSICKGAAGLTHLAEEREGGFSFDLPSGVSLEDVTGWYVGAESVDCNSTWLPVSGDADGSLASAVFPESAAYTYVTVTDSRGYRITTPMKAL